MNITEMKVNGIDNPVGFSLDEICISWKVTETDGKRQKYARIEVSDTAGFSQILYKLEGKELRFAGQKIEFVPEPCKRYYYRIHVLADNGEHGLSPIGWFERGKGKEPWHAKFISMQPEDEFHPVFFKTFFTSGRICRARIYVSGLGLYEAWLNGQKIGEDYLAPFCNDYHKRIQYQTYDVTDMLKAENQLCIYAGNGWYKGRLGYEGAHEVYGNRFAAVAELHIWYADGTKEVLVTDESWQYKGSDIAESDLYDGEVLNRLFWDTKENLAKPVVLPELDTALLTERYSLPLLVKKRLPVKEVLHTPAGETVLDMGQNFAGYVEFMADVPKGTRITLEFGEILNNGNFYRGNYRSAKARFEYISGGFPELVRPHFTYFGFRYVRVSGWQGSIPAQQFTGCVVYSDLQETIEFESSHPLLNRLAKNSLWSQRSNFIDMPTDCPQRDERLGWTGDAQVFAPTACYQMDTRAFYRKFLSDIYTEQKQSEGAVPNYIPDFAKTAGTSSVWGDLATFVPMTLYCHYGDSEELRKYYPMMKAWVDFVIHACEKEKHVLWDFGFHYGDWLGMDGIDPQGLVGGTDWRLIASAYYYESLKKTAEAAKILGYADDNSVYKEKAEQVYRALLEEYFTPSGRLAADTQTSYLICFKFGIYRDKRKLTEGLKQRLKKDHYKIKGGFVGATMMCQVMAANGMEDIAAEMLFQEECPGWLYCVKLGATTIWERWNSVLEDGNINETGMNSLNHYSYGAVMEYVYRYMAGIQETEPGFGSVRIAPQPNQWLSGLRVCYNSVSGQYESQWKVNEDGTLTLTVTVPFGCTAVLKKPACAEEEISLVAGKHVITYLPDRDFRSLYTMESRLGQLQKDERAMEILYRMLPQAAGLIESQDMEFLMMALSELGEMDYMGFTESNVRAAAKELLKLKAE